MYRRERPATSSSGEGRFLEGEHMKFILPALGALGFAITTFGAIAVLRRRRKQSGNKSAVISSPLAVEEDTIGFPVHLSNSAPVKATLGPLGRTPPRLTFAEVQLSTPLPGIERVILSVDTLTNCLGITRTCSSPIPDEKDGTPMILGLFTQGGATQRDDMNVYLRRHCPFTEGMSSSAREKLSADAIPPPPSVTPPATPPGSTPTSAAASPSTTVISPSISPTSHTCSAPVVFTDYAVLQEDGTTVYLAADTTACVVFSLLLIPSEGADAKTAASPEFPAIRDLLKSFSVNDNAMRVLVEDRAMRPDTDSSRLSITTNFGTVQFYPISAVTVSLCSPTEVRLVPRHLIESHLKNKMAPPTNFSTTVTIDENVTFPITMVVGDEAQVTAVCNKEKVLSDEEKPRLTFEDPVLGVRCTLPEYTTLDVVRLPCIPHAHTVMLSLPHHSHNSTVSLTFERHRRLPTTWIADPQEATQREREELYRRNVLLHFILPAMGNTQCTLSNVPPISVVDISGVQCSVFTESRADKVCRSYVCSRAKGKELLVMRWETAAAEWENAIVQMTAFMDSLQLQDTS